MGVGAALTMPATLSIITIIFPPDERAKAIAIWSGFAGAGGAIGILASGLLLKWFWWGSVFLINVPIAVLAIILVSVYVPTSKDEAERPLDPAGSLLSMAGLLLFIVGYGMFFLQPRDIEKRWRGQPIDQEVDSWWNRFRRKSSKGVAVGSAF